jgi:hypothetical protein
LRTTYEHTKMIGLQGGLGGLPPTYLDTITDDSVLSLNHYRNAEIDQNFNALKTPSVIGAQP